MNHRVLGRTGLSVSPISVGTCALGSHPTQYGYEVDTDTAVATVRRVFEGPFNFLDTSNEYSQGESERRIGLVVRENGGLPEGFVLATKVDPCKETADFSGDRVRRSVEESLGRLGLDRLQLVYLHDPERITFEEGTAPGGPLEALLELQDEGVIQHLGVAGAPIDLELKYLATDAFDVVLSHNRYSLVDQTAQPLLEAATARGIGFVNAAPYGGGMLAKGPAAVRSYCYGPASEAVLERVTAMQQLCGDYGVPLAAAALQFSTSDPRVSSTLVGMSDPERIDQTARLFDWDIPKQLWYQLQALASAGTGDLE
ncbi:aldo/keto reductase [Arthrobacter sp. MA-N2]|uniref:aldo/keto reductase n=1 Tax=Arthrobacter sp. MA-N2 TaxID=1101188 RepID=UPI000487003C|nr:aldo/keto reductase [Arthrobacter sp. MA-N2]